MGFPYLEKKVLFSISGGVAALLLFIVLIINRDNIPFFGGPREPEVIITTGTIKTNDYLGKILAPCGIPDLTIRKIEQNLRKVRKQKPIIDGKKYEVVTSTSLEFKKFTYFETDTTSYLVLCSSEGIFSSQIDVTPTVWMEAITSGTITSNMDADMAKLGLNANLVGNIMEDFSDKIFAWKIDFYTEQRIGDKFVILYERQYLPAKNRPTNQVRVLAAYYQGSGTRSKENYGIRFRGSDSARDDFFDLNGDALRKEFLRAPLGGHGFHISSRFSRSRFHPILRIYRPHHGIDYAAPIGTPVVSIGNGTVVFAGWKGGYGNCIDIRHSGKFTSRYGHLSRVLVRSGQKVGQSQRIAFSGNTGASTGPHLHFEMHVNGVQKNFLGLTFAPAKSLAAKDLPEFSTVKDQYLSRLFPGLSPTHEQKEKDNTN